MIDTLRINYESVSNNGFPKEFSISLDDLNGNKLEFVQIETNDETHPIQSDDVYTVNENGMGVKVNLISQIQVI